MSEQHSSSWSTIFLSATSPQVRLYWSNLATKYDQSSSLVSADSSGLRGFSALPLAHWSAAGCIAAMWVCSRATYSAVVSKVKVFAQPSNSQLSVRGAMARGCYGSFLPVFFRFFLKTDSAPSMTRVRVGQATKGFLPQDEYAVAI